MKRHLLFLLLLIMGLSTCVVFAENPNLQELEEQQLMIDALKSFIEDDPKAADEMEYIIQKREDVARKKANQLLEQMAVEEKATEDRTEEDNLSMGELDFVSRKLNMALVYFYETKYYLTIKECNSVLKVDPKNTLAWIRRGSGYYMIQKHKQAKKDWEIALQLTPNDKQRKDLEKYLSRLYKNSSI